ncbi:BsuBI/PstI family type II restriction endonuclease [Haloferax sulfurifontis]|uniref:Type II restriction endonuclease BsuBI n=1 Tax=Haloferax sulfurifontis TaxID=255616 RepID=A0A830E373_9EURY|nr:BsuBI/PstI family type II restriction endonuclease [Haloferax sulfurifontis]GGC49809.1 type II restriction endonuclease BsuBI [Haloferax sulfurifontis]
MSGESADGIDYDLSEAQIRRALREYGVQKSEMNSMMLAVMRLITSREFYEDYDTRYNLPDYAFQPTTIIEAGGYRENTRESVRKDALKPLREKGVLGYDEPVPNSPKTHYFLAQEFREYLNNAELEEVISEPDPVEDGGRTVSLPYHDEELHRAAGEHAELIADGLRDLVPRLAESPVLVHEGLDKSEREDIEAKELPISFDGLSFRLSVYPDAIAYDEANQVLYLLESVTSRGPFTDRRIQTLLDDLNERRQGIDGWSDGSDGPASFRVVFITMFPDVGRFRTHLMKIGGGSYIWLSDHPGDLRAFGKHDTSGDEPAGDELVYQHEVEL